MSIYFKVDLQGGGADYGYVAPAKRFSTDAQDELRRLVGDKADPLLPELEHLAGPYPRHQEFLRWADEDSKKPFNLSVWRASLARIRRTACTLKDQIDTLGARESQAWLNWIAPVKAAS
jgi:hypothetical protein